MSRIFISHSSANNAAALALASWLDAQGWSDYFLDIDDHRGIAPGERWMAALAGAVDRCEAVIFLVSPAWHDSKFCFAEFYQAKNLGKRIFGVIVEPISLAQLPEQMTAEWQVCDLTDARDPVLFSVARLPFVPETAVSFPRAGLETLARGLKKAGLDASTFVWPPQGEPDRSPYPGLRALEEVDAAVFFGREASIVRAIDQMRRVRERDVEQLFVILGASGAGKSSFLRAGLLPRLRRDSEHFIVLPPIRPERAAISGTHGLLSSLKDALAKAGKPMSTAQVRTELAATGLAGMLKQLQPAPATHRDAQPQRLAGPTLVVPVDQAEELFGSDGQDESRQFLDYVDALRHQDVRFVSPATDGQRLRVLLVLTIRSDSLPKLQAQAGLQAMSPVLFSLPAMPASEFKAVIEGPARRHSEEVKPLVIAPEVTEKLVEEAKGSDALPLLALTLEWLFRQLTIEQGTRIDYAEYQALGGVRAVINMAAKRAFESPGDEPAIPAGRQAQESLLQQTFPYIATVDPDTGEWKRRVALREPMRRRAPEAYALISRLVTQRLLSEDRRSMADSAELVEVVEVAHEALLRQWEPLERWLREYAVDLAATESIRRAANQWDRNRREDAWLDHRTHRLQAAEALWSDERLKGRFEPVDGDYLAACRQRDQRDLEEREEQLRRIAEQQAARAALQRRAIWGLSTAALFVAGLAVWIVMQTREVSLQTSLVLTGAAEAAADQKRFDQSLRLGVLAARASWLRPAHATAPPVLSRAAGTSTLRALFIGPIGHTDAVVTASFSPDGKRVVTASEDSTARVWNADAGKPVGEPMTHGKKVNSSSFSPDGKRVVTASSDSTARVWDAETGKPVGEPMTHGATVSSATFSPDGKRVVTASEDRTARVWNADSGKPVSEPMKHWATVRSASFSPDGKRVVTASEDSTARVWNTDTDTGKPVGEPMTHGDRVYSASFSPDGKRVVTASRDKTARVWDAHTGKPVGEPMMHGDGVSSASFSRDGKRVVTASEDRSARVWDIDTGKPVGESMMHDEWVHSAGFSPDGKRVVTASSDSTARVWDADTGKPVGEPMTHGDRVYSASFSPDGKRVVTASKDKMARVRDTETGKPLGEPMKNGDRIASVSFSPDGKRVVTASEDSTARVWNADTGKPVGEPMTHGKKVNSSSFSPDGKRVVTASSDSTARVWDAETGKPVGEPMTHGTTVSFASFSFDGKRVVTESQDKTVRIWDADTGKPVGEPMTHGAWVHSASFSPNSKRVVTSSGNTARVWDVDTGKPVGEPMTHGEWASSASFSPDGKRLVTSSGKTARVWETDTGKPVGEPMTHGEWVSSASFNPDGKRVVTLSGKTARVWDADTRKLLGEPMTHGDRIASVSFSPDGKRVATASEDSTSRIWDTDTGKPVVEPMTHADRVHSASFSPDGKRVVTVSRDNRARVWDAFWPSLVRPEDLIAEVCQRKLRGNVRKLTEEDVRAARILAYDRVGEDVCAGVAAVPAR